ncbi:MAG: SDR family oxidoreductase [Leucobacter sp.]|nr:SDR family oxidoreductase [Leucobacter sp.]
MTGTQTQRLAGKFAIVTGASRGIGLGIAQRLVAEGARVCITARGEEALQEAVATMPEGSAIYVAGKADNPDHLTEVMDRVADEFGALDILVNNAGINPVYGDVVDIELSAARKLFEVNVLGTLAWTQAAYHDERLNFKARHGSIINLASVAARVPSEGIGFYGVTKAALIHLTTTLAAELGPEVRVNAVAPAVVKTNFAKALYEGREEEVTAGYPLARLGTPEDVAGAVAYFVSDDASWVTGQTLTLDGGLLSAGGTA